MLWRAQPERSEWASDDSARRAYRDLSRAAEEAGRTGLGGWSAGGVRWAEYDRDRRWLYVLGQQYRLPQRDSALVVMVDRIDGIGGAPAVVGTAWIGASLPEGFWPKHWTSGDTAFTVMPRRQNEVLLGALQRSPRIREFLRCAV